MKEQVFCTPNFDGYSTIWRVVLLFKGDKYGRDNCLTWEEDAVGIEFYDKLQDEELFPGGQFVARYYAETLFGRNYYQREPQRGLNLYGSVDSWTIRGEHMKEIRDWVVRSVFM